MKKYYIFLACLLVATHTVAFTEENDSLERTSLFCKYEKNIYHPNPTYQFEGWEDESIIITSPGESFDWLWVDMYGTRFKANKNSNYISWLSVNSDFESWEYKHTLDRITGVLKVDIHVPISDEAEMSLKNQDFDKDGIIKQSTFIFKCKKTEPMF